MSVSCSRSSAAIQRWPSVCRPISLFERATRLEFIWLIDSDDPTAQTVCRELAVTHGHHPVEIVTLPPPGQRDNPKTIKLIAGLAHARGDIICVLDDDTRLPDWGLEQCLPFLNQPRAGLAFGLPYYSSFGTIWSSLLALFVNDQSLLTYIPYTAFAEPFTINGMFYATRRDVLERVGGFTGLERHSSRRFCHRQPFPQARLSLSSNTLVPCDQHLCARATALSELNSALVHLSS